MNKNRLLSIILLICNFLSMLLILAMLLLTIALVHWHINPEFYSTIPLGILNFNADINFTITKTSILGSDDIKHLPTLNDVGFFTIYLIYGQFMANLLLIFFSVREFTNVIKSVKKIQLFVSRNVYSFKKISYNLSLVFVLSSFQVISYGHTMFYGFYLNLEPLIIAIVFYSLSEIFKEGNILLEENNTTI